MFNSSEGNIKLTVLDDSPKDSENYLEIIINKNFLNICLLELLIVKASAHKIDAELTQREKEILNLIASGKNNGEIAEAMNISIHTAKMHIKNIFQKLNAKDRTEAVVTAIKNDLINIFS